MEKEGVSKATELFSGKAAIYECFRPAYPAALFDYLSQRLELKGYSRITDIGAGTGIFTRLLLERGWKVVAVEPNADMRGTLESSLQGLPGLTLNAGNAENTGLPDREMDLVTAAQAFHWFDQSAFRRECRRILKPGGHVALVWNNRDEESPLVQANAAICRRFCPGFRGFSGGEHNDKMSIMDFFGKTGCEVRAFTNNLELDRNGFIGRNLSSSYAPVAGTKGYEEFIDALGFLFNQYAEGGTLTLPNVTRSYLGSI